MKRAVMIVLCILFMGMAGYAGFRFFREWKEYRTGEKAYEELSQYVHMEESSVVETQQESEREPDKDRETPQEELQQEEAQEEINWPVIDFEALWEINSDVIAWICLEGTTINYPVVQSEDNNYYLRRLIDGTHNSSGSIFMDYRNDPSFSDQHTVIYGHNMKNDAMFAAIMNYKEQAFYEEHPRCLILTPEGNYCLEFFAGYVTDIRDDAWKMTFETDEEYSAWIAEAMAVSTFESDVVPTEQDRVVTLSTCTYEYNDARYVLHGILK